MNREQVYILILQGFKCYFPKASYYKEDTYLKFENLEYLYLMGVVGGERIEVAVLNEDCGLSVELRYGGTFLGKSIPTTSPQAMFALAKSISQMLFENILRKYKINIPEMEVTEAEVNMEYRFRWGIVHGGMPK